MVSLDIETYGNKDDGFLIVKLDPNEFLVPIKQIDGIGEFDNEFQKNKNPELGLGSYLNQNKNIPILNLKKYLHCPKAVFVPTLQSRILFLSSSEAIDSNFDIITVGFGFDAIIGFYCDITSSRKLKPPKNNSTELKCFQINSCIEMNSKIYPILDLRKLLDFSSLKSLLKDYLPEKI